MSVSDFVRGKTLPSIFTFKRDLVLKWLVDAKVILCVTPMVVTATNWSVCQRACCGHTYAAEESYYGGPTFIENDASTHWTEPHQLYTWWKNNIERRTKFRTLQADALYAGKEPRCIARARWCEAVIALTEVIRASSGYMNNLRSEQSAHSLDRFTKIHYNHEAKGKVDVSYSALDNKDAADVSEPQIAYADEEEPSRRGYLPFPLKMYDLLMSGEGQPDISWTPDGKAFQIHDPESFVQNTLVKHFKRKCRRSRVSVTSDVCLCRQ